MNNEEKVILYDSVWFDTESLIHVIAEFMSRKYNAKYYYEKEFLNGTISYKIAREDSAYGRYLIVTPQYFQRVYLCNNVNLITIMDVLSIANKMLEQDEDYLSLFQEGIEEKDGIITQKRVTNLDPKKYFEVRKFIEYLFRIQISRGGKRLSYNEMEEAMNNYLPKKSRKPRN